MEKKKKCSQDKFLNTEWPKGGELRKGRIKGFPGEESACRCWRQVLPLIPHATEQLSPRATTTEPVL